MVIAIWCFFGTIGLVSTPKSYSADGWSRCYNLFERSSSKSPGFLLKNWRTVWASFFVGSTWFFSSSWFSLNGESLLEAIDDIKNFAILLALQFLDLIRSKIMSALDFDYICPKNFCDVLALWLITWERVTWTNWNFGSIILKLHLIILII